DLRPFAARGGKLIIWNGLADPHISPLNPVAYYSAMEKLLGGERVKAFARLYLTPGAYHCSGGEGPYSLDTLSAVMAWVERGQAPNALIARQAPSRDLTALALSNQAPSNQPGSNQASSSQTAVRTRPIFPYPLTSKYVGTGSMDEAVNF